MSGSKEALKVYLGDCQKDSAVSLKRLLLVKDETDCAQKEE